jgi:uncharacterized protein YndB with AHSA1/START domain
MSDTPNAPTMAEQKLAVTRVFDAPRDQVWQAWTDPEVISKWWGPEGFDVPVSTIVVEPTTGGKFSLNMHSDAHGIDVPMDAHFLEVVQGERLVYTEPEPCLPEIKTVVGIVTFTDVDGKTEVGFDVTMQTSDEIRELSESGWAESFDRLAAVLAA